MHILHICEMNMNMCVAPHLLMIWPAEWYKPDPRRLCSSFTEQSFALLLCYLCYLELSSSYLWMDPTFTELGLCSSQFLTLLLLFSPKRWSQINPLAKWLMANPLLIETVKMIWQFTHRHTLTHKTGWVADIVWHLALSPEQHWWWSWLHVFG